ncbi:MAG: D-amino acid aminotransferase [Gammaproteobacteria bacterium]
MSIAYLNGVFLPLAEAKVSVLDRGFLFADGIYEVIPAYNGKLFLLEQHLQRLAASLEAIFLQVQVDWQTILQKLVEHNQNTNQIVYLQVTRGADSIRDHSIPMDIQPTVFAFCRPLEVLTLEQLTKGMRAITLEDTRWKDCHIKTIALLPNVLLKQTATNAGYDEAILINEGYAVECTSANLFVVYNNILMTTPKNPHILGGVTRDLILQLAQEHALPTQEKMISIDELNNAQEIWLSGSIKEIRPIVQLNDNPVGDGHAGPLWQKMIAYYREYREKQTS